MKRQTSQTAQLSQSLSASLPQNVSQGLPDVFDGFELRARTPYVSPRKSAAPRRLPGHISTNSLIGESPAAASLPVTSGRSQTAGAQTRRDSSFRTRPDPALATLGGTRRDPVSSAGVSTVGPENEWKSRDVSSRFGLYRRLSLVFLRASFSERCLV